MNIKFNHRNSCSQNDQKLRYNISFIIFIYYCLVRAFRLCTSFRFYISFTYFASYISASPLIHCIILHSFNYSVSKNYCTFWAFASLLCFLIVVPPHLLLPFSSLLLLLVLLVLLQSRLVFFLCLLAFPLFRILLLHVSGLLLSFYIVCIFFLPLLSSIPLLWSRFNIGILLIFFCPSTSSSLLNTLVTLLWRFFCNVCYIWILFVK